MAYTKLFDLIVTSSIWNEDDKVRIVWITLLALRDKNNVVKASMGGLAHQARVSREDCERAINVLTSPDTDSRTKDDEGRRVRIVDGGFFIINGAKYREMERNEERKEYFKLKKREQRAESTLSTESTPVHGESTESTETETETEGSATLKDGTTAPSFGIPRLADIQAEAQVRGGTPDMAQAYYDDREAMGWAKRGEPIRNWRADFAGFRRHWQANDHQRKTKNHHGHQNARKPSSRAIGTANEGVASQY